MAFAPGPARTLGISPPERPRGKQSWSQIGPVHDKLRHRGSASPPWQAARPANSCLHPVKSQVYTRWVGGATRLDASKSGGGPRGGL